MEILDRQIGDYYKMLQPVPDEADLVLHKRNCSADLMTKRTHELIPLLRFVGCRVESIDPSGAVVTIPLLENAMNQNGTQYASIYYMLTDFALAAGIFSALPGVYVSGIHDRCRAMPIQLWTREGNIQHVAPGLGTIKAIARISPENAASMRQELVRKGRTDCNETIEVFQGDELVAVGKFKIGIYADLPRTPGKRVGLFQGENLKLSALLLAGLRADPLSQSIAQEQGRAIAARMTASTPQFPVLVQARTTHLENYLRHAGASHEQVVVLGVGFDTKPFRFAREGQQWFGIDLRTMIKAREEALAALNGDPEHFTAVEGDIRTDSWPDALKQAGYQEHLSTVFILEGLSMYVESVELRSVLVRLGALTSHQGSRVWLDHVTSAMFELDLPEVRTFLDSMNRLGEPFVLGFADADAIAQPHWKVQSSTTSAKTAGIEERVYQEYRFSVLGPCN